jgi:hypothetical protein
MAEPDSAAANQPSTIPTPADLERWAVAAILETATYNAGLIGTLKHDGTRALRGRPFTFHCQLGDHDGGTTMVLHGTIVGIVLLAGADRGSGVERVVYFHTNLIGGKGETAMIAYREKNEKKSSWVVTDGNDLSDQGVAGTLEIG